MATTYLDWAATAPIEPTATEAMARALREWANPSSAHRPGQRARAALEEARQSVADHLGCLPSELVFTSGGTEALGLALSGADRRLVGATEHPAVLAQAPAATVLPVGSDGAIDLLALEAALAAGPALVAVQAANNETGVLQPISEIAALVRAAGGRLLSDAVQSAGKLALPEADYVTVSAHKLGGPPGVGALIVCGGAPLAAVQHGGGQERGLRAGTENLPGIIGFSAALSARAADAGWYMRATALRDRLEARIGVRGHGADGPRLSTITSLWMPGVAAMTQLMALDLAGFAVSAGAACSSGMVEASRVLTAMGLGAAAGESIRVSLGWTTTEAEVDAFAAAWLALRDRLAAKAA